jgi:hypothetical protein
VDKATAILQMRRAKLKARRAADQGE